MPPVLARPPRTDSPRFNSDMIRRQKNRGTRRANITLGAKIDDYLAIRRKNLRKTTMRGIEGSLKGQWRPSHGHRIASNYQGQRRRASDRIAHAERRGRRRWPRGACSMPFSVRAIGEGLCDANPLIGTNRAEKSKAGKCVLTDRELRTIWLALPSGDYGLIVKLAILTGSAGMSLAAWVRIGTCRSACGPSH